MRKGSNPPPPDVSLRPQPSPAPPPKRQVIEVRHTCDTESVFLQSRDIFLRRLYRLEDRFQLILDEIAEIKKTINKKQD